MENNIIELLSQTEKVKVEAPKPLFRTSTKQLDFPIYLLGKLAQEAVESLHDITSAPLAICAQSLLSAMTLAVQGHINVRMHYGQVRPVSNFFITIAESGERKTSCDNEALKSIIEHEEILQNNYNKNLKKYNALIKIYEENIEKKLKNNSNIELDDAPEKPLQPIIIINDQTIEGLLKNFKELQPSIGIFSSEGGGFLGGYNMLKENKLKSSANLSELWDGKGLVRIRSSDGISNSKPKYVSLHLMLQPDMANKFFSDDTLNDQGLFSRMLVVFPKSRMGERFYKEPNAESFQKLESFHTRIKNFLETPYKFDKGRLKLKTLELNKEAKLELIKFGDEIEKGIAPNGIYEPIRGFANKMLEHTLRLAAVLAYFEDNTLNTLNETHIKNSIKLVQYYSYEMINIIENSKIDKDLQIAQHLLSRLHNHWEFDIVSLPDIYQSITNKIKNVTYARKIVSILEENHWLVKIPEGANIGNEFRKEAWSIIKPDNF